MHCTAIFRLRLFEYVYRYRIPCGSFRLFRGTTGGAGAFAEYLLGAALLSGGLCDRVLRPRARILSHQCGLESVCLALAGVFVHLVRYRAEPSRAESRVHMLFTWMGGVGPGRGQVGVGSALVWVGVGGIGLVFTHRLDFVFVVIARACVCHQASCARHTAGNGA